MFYFAHIVTYAQYIFLHCENLACFLLFLSRYEGITILGEGRM